MMKVMVTMVSDHRYDAPVYEWSVIHEERGVVASGTTQSKAFAYAVANGKLRMLLDGQLTKKVPQCKRCGDSGLVSPYGSDSDECLRECSCRS